jgi:hypothetical protein
MKARIRLFWYFTRLGYSVGAAWHEADRQQKFARRTRHAHE